MRKVSKTATDNERHRRPKTKGEAMLQVEQIFNENDWNAVEQETYKLSLELPTLPLNELTVDQLKVILNDFERARMILFYEPKEQGK